MPQRLVTLLLLCAAFHVSAQNAPASCPTVDVSCPDTVKSGADLTFTVSVSGGDRGVGCVAV